MADKLPDKTTRPLKILVTGPTGTTGRAVVKELLERGHRVTGLSRNPSKWGTHPNYLPLKGSQMGDLEALIVAVEGHDVVVSAFAPSHNEGSDTYIGLVEGAWRLKDAVKQSKSKPYLIYVGGAGSLRDPGTGKITLDQPEKTWAHYLISGPIEHLNWLRYVVNMPLMHVYYHLRGYRDQSSILYAPARWYTRFFENLLIDKMKNEKNLTMPHACRAAVGFFEQDVEFEWTFLSPPWFYREGPKSGKYGTIKNFQPVDEAGRWLGINNGDIAVAIADEVEGRSKKWIHWSCYGWQEDTTKYYCNYQQCTFERFERK